MAAACLHGEAERAWPRPMPVLPPRKGCWLVPRELARSCRATHMELRFGEVGQATGGPPSRGPVIGDSPGRLVSPCSWVSCSPPFLPCWAIWSLPPPPHGGRLPPRHPKTRTSCAPLAMEGDQASGRQELRTRGDLGGDPKGLGVSMERRACLPLLFPLVDGCHPDP